MRPMQYTNRPSRSDGAPRGKSSYITLLAIVGFGVGILAGYHFLGSPHTAKSALRRTTMEAEHLLGGSALPGKDNVVAASKASGAAAPKRAGTPDVIVIEGPAPHVNVGAQDERHPKHMATILSGQSSHDEHKSGTVSAMQRQQSDSSEDRKAKGDAAAAAKGGAASAAAKGGKGGSTASLTAAAAGAPTKASLPAKAVVSKDKAVAAVAAAITTAATAEGVAAAAMAAASAKFTADTKGGGAAAAGKTKKGPFAAGNQPQAPAAKVLKVAEGKGGGAAAAPEAKQSAAGTVATAAGGSAAHKAASNLLTAEQLHDGKVLPEEHAAAVHITGDMPTAHAAGKAPAAAGAKAGAASAGTSTTSAAAVAGRPKGDTIHTLFTSNGSPYQNFQARIMVATYHLVRKKPGGEHMVAITRILHRTKLDGFEVEMPTFRADPLQPECDQWCWFPVADRANAVKQFNAAADKDPSLIKGAWLLLLESDYVWTKPMPVPGDAWDPTVPGRSFAFDYISVTNNPIVAEILQERCPDCDPKTVPNSGPAPVLLRFEDLKKATPVWEELTTWIETHEHAKKQLGWVREMYAWDIAVAMFKLNIKNEGVKTTCLIAQPPHDVQAYDTTMYHYTWGSIFKQNGTEIWKFDKRFYTDPKDALKIPKLVLPPPIAANDNSVRLQDGVAVTKELRDTLADMLQHMNDAIDTLPDLTGKIKPA